MFAVYFDGLEQCRQASRRQNDIRIYTLGLEDAYAAGFDVRRRYEQFQIGAGPDAVEIDELIDDATQRVYVERIEFVWRERAGKCVEPEECRGIADAPTIGEDLERIAADRAERRIQADFLPKRSQMPPRALPTATHTTIGENDSVHGAGAGAAECLYFDPLVLKKTIQNAPCECTVRATAL